MRDRIDRRGPSRGFAWLLVWSALLFSAYVGVFLFSFSDFDAEATVPSGYTYTNLMLLPVLLFSGLISGARERFSIRSRPTPLQLLGYVAAVLGFMVLGALNIAGVDYPSWLNALAPVALFTVMGAAPLRRLLATRSGDEVSGRWRNDPLTIPARWTTAAIGVVLGILATTSTWTWFPIVSAGVLMATLLAALIGWRMPWGLMRVGYRWGPAHWVLFAAATAAMFALVVVLTRTEGGATFVAGSLGALSCAAMVIAAVIPLRSSRG